MSAKQIVQDIHWVGAIDWNVRHFHGYTYSTKRGTTYNAYLIMDDQITLVDTVYGPFASEMFDSIRQITPLHTIKYIIANHIETDHSGALPQLLSLCPKATVIGTEKCKEGLAKQYGIDWQKSAVPFKTVKTNDRISIGKKTLSFIEAPMIHWPDSMFTYCPEERLLMPNDAFGQHYATSERFDDEADQSVLMNESAVYYANILWPLGGIIAQKIEEIVKMNIPISMIAPSHGLIWRKYPERIIQAYQSWTQNKTTPKVVMVYETMWNATEKMCRVIADALIAQGVRVKLYDINQSDRTDIITEMLDSKGYLIGSSTHDNDMLPNIAGFLELFKGLKPKNRIGAAFGSYGWAGGAVKEIEEVLKSSGVEVAQPGLSIKYTPNEQELKQCYEFGKTFAAAVKKV